MSRSPAEPPEHASFTAATVELALAAARAEHGPGVQVVRALKVVSGVRGLLGQARYTVVVRRPLPVRIQVETTVEVLPREDADPVRGALEDLLDAADAGERAAGPSDWQWSEPSEVDRLLAQLSRRGDAEAVRHPALSVAEHDLPVDDSPADLGALLALPQHAEPPWTGWDRDELRRLGVPGPVLSRLPVEDPSDDAGWRRALVTAIAGTVPAPATADAQHPVVVSGHGLLGAVAVLQAAIEASATPGTISHDGRVRPATPAAIVDVLAACARS